MTIPDRFRRRTQWQNNAIEKADEKLETAELPTYSEAITSLADLLTWIGSAPDVPPATIAAAHTLIDRATGCSQ
jgi:hypothetical protein